MNMQTKPGMMPKHCCYMNIARGCCLPQRSISPLPEDQSGPTLSRYALATLEAAHTCCCMSSTPGISHGLIVTQLSFLTAHGLVSQPSTALLLLLLPPLFFEGL